jgi:hypothetical protein
MALTQKENEMNDTSELNIDKAHLEFAKGTNGVVWNLLMKEDRSAQENEEMIHAAHASLYHWSNVGTPLNQQRGQWLLAHIYTILGRVEAALYHAQRCLAMTEEHGDLMKDFDIAYGYEGIARAQALAGNSDESKKLKTKAQKAGENITDPEDKKIFMGDFTSGDWYGIE